MRPAKIATYSSLARKVTTQVTMTAALALSVLMAAVPNPAVAQDASAAKDKPAWLDPALLAKAKAEGSVTVYSSTNEGEGLPLFKMFEDATGIKVNYVRAADGPLMGRVAVEYRANQNTFDVMQTTTVNKMPSQFLAQIDPPEAKNIIPAARDPERRWYGIYANYNTPAYNSKLVKASDLPKTYEDFLKHPEWKGKVAIDNSDNEWLAGMLQFYGEEKGTKLIKDLVKTLQPVVTSGHLAMAQQVGAGEYAIALNNYTMLTMNVKLRGNPTEFWAMDPVILFFGQVGVSSKAPHPNAARLVANFMLSKQSEAFLTKFGRIPTRTDTPSNPPTVGETMAKHKVITVLLKPSEEKKWQQRFDSLFKPR